MRWEEAHFLGGPLDGEVRMIEYMHSRSIPVEMPAERGLDCGWEPGPLCVRRERYFKVWEGPAHLPGRKHPRAILVHSEWE